MSGRTRSRQKRKIAEACSTCTKSISGCRNDVSPDANEECCSEELNVNSGKRTRASNTPDQSDVTAGNHDCPVVCSEQASNYLPSSPVTLHGRRPPGKDPSKTVNIAVSSRALFDIEEEHKLFLDKGLEAYINFQKGKESEILKPGSAFPFIKALENVNNALRKMNPDEEELFSVTLMSKNNAQVGIRLQKSIDKYEGLKIQRMALTGGTAPVQYLKPFNMTLFLTCDQSDVVEAIKQGFPSAVMSPQITNPPSETQLRVAFDLDAVLFSDESERVFKTSGLEAFLEHEKRNRDNPLPDGPLKRFAMALGKMQKKFARSENEICPIRTFLVTSRDSEVGERALKTLRCWGLEIDESFFMAGAPKSDLLLAINPHIFFDDQKSHIDGARMSGTPSGHVPYTTGQRCDQEKREAAKANLLEKMN